MCVNTSCRARFLSAAILLFGILLAAPAAAYETVWLPDTGNWSDPGCWSLGEPAYDPGDFNTWAAAVVENGGTITLDQAGEICHTLQLAYRSGAGNVNMTGGGLTVAQTLSVGNRGTGVFTQHGGAVNAGALWLANSLNTHGAYNLHGGTLAAGSVLLGWGEARVKQTGGSCVTGGVGLGTDDAWALSGNASLQTGTLTSEGTVTQEGTSAVTADSIDVDLSYDAAPGPVLYSIADQATLDCGTLNIGRRDPTVFRQTGGTVTVTGNLHMVSTSSSTATATLELSAGTLHAAGAYVGSGGQATVTHTGGEFNIDWFLYLGQSSPATYDLSGTGALNTRATIITVGEVNHTAGTHAMTEYLRMGCSWAPCLYNLGGTGRVEAAWMAVGSSGHATFTQTGGECDLAQYLVIGDSSDADGVYSLGGTGALTVPEIRVVGIRHGSGTFHQTGGEANVSGDLVVRSSGDHPAQVILEGGTLRVGHLDVGGPWNLTDVGEVRWSGGTLEVDSVTLGARVDHNAASTGRFIMDTAAAGGPLVLKTGALAIDTLTSQLDLGAGALVVDYADAAANPLADLAAWIISGRNGAGGGAWDGFGIVSSAAAADPDGLTGLGIIDNADPVPGGLTTWMGVDVDATCILVRYTWNGDSNLDGLVDADDYDVVDNSFVFGVGARGYGWWSGDLDGDGSIDADDYDLIDNAFVFGGGPLGGPPAAVPEPATLALVAFGALWLVRRAR
jgi:hypothetical protein